MKDSFSELEKKLKVKFNNLDYLKEALTHRSYLNENSNWPYEDNERLEFLGDAVLELVVSDFLYRNYPDLREGEMTTLRATLANTVSLLESANKLGINNYLLLSKGEAKNLASNSNILANALEAIIGAIYLDQGYQAAENFIKENILSKLKSISSIESIKDPKSLFQEIIQGKYGITPHYQTLESWGPDHDKMFKVGVFLNDKIIAIGEGHSKQEAEANAAHQALQKKDW
ncbi:MAG TPA: ribonuclease III [Candidatus Paceibacterota bacterium]|nr:ribonuclease III [Candidatus Paceibacterota bacterium]HOK97291.1 ribonuclease III [Candidatus Paceibacterota bacterium]HPP64727.1 ribonuclease III [Candidatus Paceibacterota bacterium]